MQPHTTFPTKHSNSEFSQCDAKDDSKPRKIAEALNIISVHIPVAIF